MLRKALVSLLGQLILVGIFIGYVITLAPLAAVGV
jgi:hypothetical protein